MLKFDAETARLLEIAYLGADVTARRRVNLDALHLEPGDHLLDIGCGNGLLCAEAARSVGAGGSITGVDPSADMRAPAETRCDPYPWVRIVDGTATDLPCEANSVDKAVSIQVFEYLPDVPSALAEVHRVLRPDGRLVLGDIDFGTLIWFSDAPHRMERMQTAWNDHLADSHLPQRLPQLLRQAGFVVDQVAPFTTVDHMLKPDGLANMLIALMHPFAIDTGHMSQEEAQGWADEQRALAEQGRFFFSITHFSIAARKS